MRRRARYSPGMVWRPWEEHSGGQPSECKGTRQDRLLTSQENQEVPWGECRRVGKKAAAQARAFCTLLDPEPLQEWSPVVERVMDPLESVAVCLHIQGCTFHFCLKNDPQWG